MKIPDELMYTKDHEWFKKDGEKALVGITDFAQHSLGDIVFVELPDVGTKMEAGEVLAVVESVKAASDVYSPLSGEVEEINSALIDAPEKLNADPYGNWMAVLRTTEASIPDTAMNAGAYKEFCEGEE